MRTNKLKTPIDELFHYFLESVSFSDNSLKPDIVLTKIQSMKDKEKEFARQCFVAGKTYWSFVQIDEPALKPIIGFDEWYDKLFNDQV